MDRKCRLCKLIKDIRNFPKDNSKSLGRSYKCKVCMNKKSREYRLSHLDYFKNYFKNYSYVYNTDKVRARVKLNQRVIKGTIIKLPCSICGNIKSEAHHSDYLKPFEVIWLCRKHHTELHNNLKLFI